MYSLAVRLNSSNSRARLNGSSSPAVASRSCNLLLNDVIKPCPQGQRGGFQPPDTRYISWYSPPPVHPAALGPAALRTRTILRFRALLMALVSQSPRGALCQ